ncbi:hypothetical protein TRVL_04727 [Trypanosoma vivax]|nr:hypothetical protein TRVL_04727 [Trypanosoma vivax]
MPALMFCNASGKLSKAFPRGATLQSNIPRGGGRIRQQPKKTLFWHQTRPTSQSYSAGVGCFGVSPGTRCRDRNVGRSPFSAISLRKPRSLRKGPSFLCLRLPLGHAFASGAVEARVRDDVSPSNLSEAGNCRQTLRQASGVSRSRREAFFFRQGAHALARAFAEFRVYQRRRINAFLSRRGKARLVNGRRRAARAAIA